MDKFFDWLEDCFLRFFPEWILDSMHPERDEREE